MLQAKFSIEDMHAHFLNSFKVHGFKDKSAMVRIAIDRLREEMELESLKKSADLYFEIYDDDEDLRLLTESATAGWPE